MYFETHLFQTLHCTEQNTSTELPYIYMLQLQQAYNRLQQLTSLNYLLRQCFTINFDHYDH